MKKPTIFDLERLTGYSIGTISRAFNKSPTIKASTRELILKKAREISYVPHAGARAITQGRTRRWGLLLPHLRNPRYSEIMDHLDLEARTRSTMLLLGLSRYDAAIEAELALHWASGETDGIIADSCIDPKVFYTLRERRVPMVFLFGRPSTDFHMVQTSVARSCDALMRRLLELGHRRVGYVGQANPTCRIHGSFTAYETMLREYGVPVDESLLFFGTHEYTAGEQAWRHWAPAERPSAILCYNDNIACKIISLAQAEGVQVPRDLSIVGADDIPEAALCNLTTMHLDPAQLARDVFALLEKDPGEPGQVRVVHSTVVERGSVAPPPASVTAADASKPSTPSAGKSPRARRRTAQAPN